MLAHHLVIAPAPNLMALIPESLRAEVVRKVTERAIEVWHVPRGLNIPDYSYVLHDRNTDDDYGLQNLHTDGVYQCCKVKIRLRTKGRLSHQYKKHCRNTD